MFKITAILPMALMLALPFTALAHEHQIFEINGIKYEFGIGSANEPIVVDDKSGVELNIMKAGVVAGHEEHHDEHATEGAVVGLEKTLKVELIAGEDRKTLDLVPGWSAPGFYNATFYPTEATALSYRVFGTIDEIPVDITFTCTPRHDMEGVDADTTRTEISPGVVRIEKRGSFGCPMEKADLGFPVQSSTIEDVREKGSSALAVALGSGALALFALGVAWKRRS
jgi:hypothetical protein